MRKCFAHAIPILAVLVFVAGCASTTLQSEWRDPAYNAGPFKKIFVIGLSARDVTARRVFEDVMVSKLMAAGVQAIPEWQYVKGEGQVPESAMSAAVDSAGADAVLMARLVAIDKQIQVNPVVIPGPGPGFGWYGPYAGWYSGWYAYPSVTQYDVVYVETTLFDQKTKRLVWSATSKTVDPASVQQEAPAFADTIIAAMQKAGVLPAPKS
jgi:hypothetical protein